MLTKKNYKLVPGDILLFTAPNPSWKQKLIMWGQAISSLEEHGHYNTVHAAVYAGENPTGEPLIAHLLANGYNLEPLDNYANREGSFRPFHVFRPKSTEFANAVKEIAQEPKKTGQTIHYSIPSAISSFNRLFDQGQSKTSATKSTYSTSSFCSRFAIETLQRAANTLSPVQANQYRPKIYSNTTTRGLEAYLSSQKNTFDHYVVLDRDPIKGLLKSIDSCTDRLKKIATPAAQKKVIEIQTKLAEAMQKHNPDNDGLIATKMIFLHIKDALAIKRGLFKSSTLTTVEKTVKQYHNLRFFQQKTPAAQPSIYQTARPNASA